MVELGSQESDLSTNEAGQVFPEASQDVGERTVGWVWGHVCVVSKVRARIFTTRIVIE